MNFTLDESQTAVRELAAQILDDKATPERHRALEDAGESFDRSLWSELATAGLLGIGLPEEYGGGGLGFVEVGLLLTEAGGHAAKVPLLPTLTTAAAVAAFGPADLAKHWLPQVCAGDVELSAALASFPDPPLTASASGAIDGVASFVPAGLDASAVLVFAENAAGGLGAVTSSIRTERVSAARRRSPVPDRSRPGSPCPASSPLAGSREMVRRFTSGFANTWWPGIAPLPPGSPRPLWT